MSLDFYIWVLVASRTRCDETGWRCMLNWDIYVCQGGIPACPGARVMCWGNRWIFLIGPLSFVCSAFFFIHGLGSRVVFVITIAILGLFR